MKISNNVTELIGNTPLVRINKLNSNGCATIVAKLEYFNPLSSIKDRTALNLIESAEKEGKLIPNETTLIEPTSGNTGIGLAYISAIKGYKLILTMPETMSLERRMLVKALGAEVILTPAKDGMKGSIDKAEELNREIQNSYILRQFDNPANPEIHEKTTAVEIWNDTDGKVDIFVATVGTGGTLIGTARKLKKYNPNVKIVAVEPASSPLLSGGQAGAHKIQGIGANFIPSLYDSSVVDEIITISDEDAINTAKDLMKNEGIFAGISSGAAVAAAIKLSEQKENKDKLIVTILPDTAERYLSTELFK